VVAGRLAGPAKESEHHAAPALSTARELLVDEHPDSMRRTMAHVKDFVGSGDAYDFARDIQHLVRREHNTCLAYTLPSLHFPCDPSANVTIPTGGWCSSV
jgi:hypothetical protein